MWRRIRTDNPLERILREIRRHLENSDPERRSDPRMPASIDLETERNHIRRSLAAGQGAAAGCDQAQGCWVRTANETPANATHRALTVT